jgi:SAM-dependent methyltransferase
MNESVTGDSPDPPGSIGGPAHAFAKASLQAQVNASMWSAGRDLRTYDNAELLPAESLILSRYREALTGRVLDLGCGSGRILGYLLLLGAHATGVDLSARMVERCRQRFPGADVRVGDLADLAATADGQYDAILMTADLIDVFDDTQRRRVLGELRGRLVPDGLLVFSSHNLDQWDQRASGHWQRLSQTIRAAIRRNLPEWVRWAIEFPQERRNRRRLGPLQYRADDHAVINDDVHRYGLLHYYIGRVAQQRQLGEIGYDLIDVLEADGPTVPEGEAGRSESLYYVTTPCPAPMREPVRVSVR